MCNWPIRVHYFLLLCYFVSFYLGSEGGGGIPRKTWVELWGMSCKTELTLIFLNYAMGFSLPCLRPDLKEVTEGAGREQNVIRTTLRARDQHTQAPTYGLASILPIRMHTAIYRGSDSHGQVFCPCLSSSAWHGHYNPAVMTWSHVNSCPSLYRNCHTIRFIYSCN